MKLSFPGSQQELHDSPPSATRFFLIQFKYCSTKKKSNKINSSIFLCAKNDVLVHAPTLQDSVLIILGGNKSIQMKPSFIKEKVK
jgi:hypothetical protein